MLIIGRRKTAALLLACGILTLYILFGSSPNSSRPWLLRNTQKTLSAEESLKLRLSNPLHFERPSKVACNDHLLGFQKKVFYALRTTSDTIWSSVPLLQSTVLTRFPYHAVFSDSASVVGSTRVIDVVSTLSREEQQNNPALDSYRVRRYGIDQDWGWAPEEYESGDINAIRSLMTPAILKYIRDQVDSHTDWYILADESSYVSAEALLAIVSKLNPDVPKVFTWGKEGPSLQLVWSRAAFNAVLSGDIKNFEQRMPSGNISSTAVAGPSWCEPIAFYYDLSHWEIQTLYDREKSSLPSVTQADYYRDYILPFIATEIQDWEIDPKGPRYADEIENMQPHLKKRHCKRLCEMNENCLAWQWRENTECQLDEDFTLRRGSAKNTYLVGHTDETPRVHSGFIIDRVRAVRNWSDCDPLFIQPTMKKEANDNELTAEGWITTIRDRMKLEGSDVLQAMHEYDQQLGA